MADDEAYERTSETIKIERLKLHNEKRQKGLSMAKMCSLCMNLGVLELHQITESTKSQIKLNMQNMALKHTMAQERKQSGKQKYYVL